ncbi:MAG: Dam family site-specific DNA-(adenine-N6)-methyltransferase [Euryarchaeota archaeon]|nr:Dam family site-specific DNA-(adenine-N6)-methyltransferase [Euryarchaeota archaeon]
MKRVPHPIPYQGSKRNISRTILSFFPLRFDTLVEPFAGSAAVSLATASHGKSHRFHINDLNKPLMDLWTEIITNPNGISDGYENLRNAQKDREKEFYFTVRDKFNNTGRPDYFLYLLARCVKASIRYNSKGEFNQSPDNRRKGRHPDKMRSDIFVASYLLRGRTTITYNDYKNILKNVSKTDLVYMDPPYQGVCTGRDPRYYTGIDFDDFLSQIEKLVRRRISFILSYDGRKGGKTYGKEIPTDIDIQRIEVNAGRSTQSTLLGMNEITYESIYLSGDLVNRLNLPPDKILSKLIPHRGTKQMALPLN